MAKTKKSTKNTKYSFWTVAEEDIVMEEIGKNPTNLTACFFMASQLINRSPGAISNHYYGKMIDNPNCVAKLTIGRTACVKNRTRLKFGEQPKSILRSSWDFIISLIFGIKK